MLVTELAMFQLCWEERDWRRRGVIFSIWVSSSREVGSNSGKLWREWPSFPVLFKSTSCGPSLPFVEARGPFKMLNNIKFRSHIMPSSCSKIFSFHFLKPFHMNSLFVFPRQPGGIGRTYVNQFL